MPDTRRRFLKKSLSLFAYIATATGGMLESANSFAAWPAANFAQRGFDATMTRVFGKQKITKTKKIKLKLPRIAENGALVPITVSSRLDNVESIYILVEKNPVPLAASFKLSPQVDAFVSSRLKMAETSNVYAVVKANGKLYSASKNVKVTIGGCGG